MDPKPARVTVRLGPADVAALAALAHALGGNLSEALRYLVREYAKAGPSRRGAKR
jgi:hypothetical protein